MTKTSAIYLDSAHPTSDKVRESLIESPLLNEKPEMNINSELTTLNIDDDLLKKNLSSKKSSTENQDAIENIDQDNS